MGERLEPGEQNNEYYDNFAIQFVLAVLSVKWVRINYAFIIYAI